MSSCGEGGRWTGRKEVTAGAPVRIGVNLLFARPGYVGGTVAYAKGLIGELARQGRWEIILYVRKGAFPFGEAEGVRRYEVSTGPTMAARVFYEHLILPFVARRHGVRLLYSPGFVGPVFGRFGKVVTIHDFYYKRFPAFVRPLQRAYWSVMVPASGRASDAITVVSESTRRDLAHYYPSLVTKACRVYPGAPVVARKAAAEQSSRFVLFVGYVTPNKNIEVLLEAIEDLSARGLAVHLLIAGTDLYGIARRWVARNGKLSRVVIRANTTDEELIELYRRALCLVVPSVYEGFGLPALEAMAIGCPVLVSGGGALAEVVKDCGRYFAPDRPEELAALIEELAESPALREILIQRGYRRASEFSWGRSAEELAAVFYRVLDFNEQKPEVSACQSTSLTARRNARR